MKSSFRPVESNKYLSETWQEAVNDKKKTTINIDDYKNNIASSNISFLGELQKSYNALKQDQQSSTSK
ncbi:hypothetical protein DLAC_06047 [Tieghemostelium lacteum]|uniref:Uncharacterized protein n=1 Tax=Tieghemostelium lacteum TaxID=361077 RepID=A0A151ZHA9_TIELA|nr:hypothetical protein DLAC_06047 [Tieghemostelium lacteum]|eukprot:KYQ93371.1 hypothetical protein DLAC_06047 [Tieghemostelium lacteum]